MATYYVSIPGYQVTAEVEAPGSKAARTTYLDFLTRNKMLSWKDRQAVRPRIKIARMQSGEIQTAVQLSYTGREAANDSEDGVVALKGAQQQEQQQESQQPDLNPYDEVEPGQEGLAEAARPLPQGRFVSPIMELSRRRGGF